MSDTTELTIGRDVSCSDGARGELKRVVVDPVAKALTQLVVEPKHGSREGCLVPVHLVASAGEEIRLRCATAEFAELEHVEETQLLPGASGQMGLRRRADRLVAVHGLGMGGMGTGGMGLGT